MKYDKIVAMNREKSRQKAQSAIKQIQIMLETEERITVQELSRRTGYAKSFFYRNQTVRKVLENARSKQLTPCNSMQIIRALEAEDEIINLKIEIIKLKKEKEDLICQNKLLKQMLDETRGCAYEI